MNTAALASDFHEKGWATIPHDPMLREWVEATLPAARATVAAPENAQWHRYQGTWFAGVNVLPNGPDGAVAGAPPLSGTAVEFIHDTLGIGGFDWEPAQISVCYPGYPKPMEGESEGLFRFRLNRDAAHVDGLLREGPARRRFLREHHAFILGIPMVDYPPEASPFTVWEGSHHAVRECFTKLYTGLPPNRWGEVDVTEAYMALRKELFDTCPRREIWGRPGEAYVVHRLALHGMAPWPEAVEGQPDGRMIAYFRPEHGGPEAWLNAP